MAKQTLTALYDDRRQAELAETTLKQSGVPAADIVLSPQRSGAGAASTGGDGDGFWASVDKFFGGTEDRETYREGVRRGGTLLTAHVAEDHVDKAVELLERHGSVDFDERETSWRREGWTGRPNSDAMATAQARPMGLAMGGTPAPKPVAAPTAKAPAVAGRGDEQVIQVVEERLDVGRRAVNRGKVRLHSYVIEKDASADVSLRNETVSIDRRPVDRLVSAPIGDAFKERTIEMEETAQEAVVGKTAHVVEEIGIRKDVKDRVETVHDSVRGTKVDIDDDRGARKDPIDDRKI